MSVVVAVVVKVKVEDDTVLDVSVEEIDVVEVRVDVLEVSDVKNEEDNVIVQEEPVLSERKDSVCVD